MSSVVVLGLSACDTASNPGSTGGALQQDGTAGTDASNGGTDATTGSDAAATADGSADTASDVPATPDDVAQGGTDAAASPDVAPACKTVYADVQTIFASKCTGSCHKHSFDKQCNFAKPMGKSIKAAVNGGVMPPSTDPALTAEEKATILKWVADGSLCEGGC